MIEQIVAHTMTEGLAIAESALERVSIESLGDMDGFSELEKRAIIEVEKLRRSSQLELANLLLRGKIIERISSMRLYSAHPNGYNSLEEMAADVGISKTELSSIIIMQQHVVPYLQSVIGMSMDDICAIPKSNIRAALPHLQVLITGKPSKSQSVNKAVEKILKDTDSENPEEDAVRHIIDSACLPSISFKKMLNPEHTENIPVVMLQDDVESYCIMKMTSEQFVMLQRIAGDHMDIFPGDIAYIDKLRLFF